MKEYKESLKTHASIQMTANSVHEKFMRLMYSDDTKEVVVLFYEIVDIVNQETRENINRILSSK